MSNEVYPALPRGGLMLRPDVAVVGPMPPGVQPCDVRDSLRKIVCDAGESDATAETASCAVVLAIERTNRQATLPKADLEKAWPAFVALSQAYALMTTELLFAYVAAHKAGVQLDSVHPDAGKATLSPLN